MNYNYLTFHKVLRTVFVMFLISVVPVYSQLDSAIQDIKELYVDYQKGIIEKGDSFRIYFVDDSEAYSMKIYTDTKGKLMISSKLDHESAVERTDYYFRNDKLQFVFSENNESLDHWNNDTIRFRQWENRYYLKDGRVIRTLVKEFYGIEGIDDNPDMTKVANKEISVSPTLFDEKAKVLIGLYHNLDSFYIKPE